MVSTTDDIPNKPKMHHAFRAKGKSRKKMSGVEARFHVLTLPTDHATVDAFYAAAIAIGAKDNGKPGVRSHYHSSYYAAFVFDPLGHNIEVVCHVAS